MAKGINIFGTLSGTLGETVYYRSGGEQKQRIRVRRPNNPNTDAQIVQRAKFSGAGMFYAHGNQAFFPYAFENKRKNESNFNAFMRENAPLAYPVSKDVKNSASYPIFNHWVMSRGSLSQVMTIVANGSGANKSKCVGRIDLHKDFEVPATVKELSQLLISTGDWQDRDIFTFLVIVSNLTSEQVSNYPEISPENPAGASWIINQFNLDLKNTNSLSSYGINVAKDGTFMDISMSANPEVSNATSGACCCFHSRMTKTTTKVSTQVLELIGTIDGALLNKIGDPASYQQYVRDVIANYRGEVNLALRATEILQGSNSVNIDFEEEQPVGPVITDYIQRVGNNYASLSGITSQSVPPCQASGQVETNGEHLVSFIPVDGVTLSTANLEITTTNNALSVTGEIMTDSPNQGRLRLNASWDGQTSTEAYVTVKYLGLNLLTLRLYTENPL